jgi:hypothetical protein
MRRRAIAALLLLSVTATAAATSSSSVRSLLDRAKRAVMAKDIDGALALLASAEDALRAEAPLQMTHAVVVDADHKGTGTFVESAGTVVRNRRLRIYLEVDNFTTVAEGTQVRMQLDVEGTFFRIDADGTADRIGTLPLGSHAVTTHDVRKKTSFTTDIALQGKSPAGKYRVDVVVKDALGSKSALRAVAFVLPDES